MGQSTIVLVVADNAYARTADTIYLVLQLVLHKTATWEILFAHCS